MRFHVAVITAPPGVEEVGTVDEEVAAEVVEFAPKAVDAEEVAEREGVVATELREVDVFEVGNVGGAFRRRECGKCTLRFGRLLGDD